MAGGSSNSDCSKPRKRVGVGSTAAPTLVRAKDGSAFAKCEECNKDVPVALISMHGCSLDAKIKMDLAAQVVEVPAQSRKKPAGRNRSKSSELKAKRVKGPKKGEDSNALKRPSTAFFLFMIDYRKAYNEANPEAKAAKQVAKEGGEKWKSMTEGEKKHYLDKAAELKAEYEKALAVKNDDDNEDDESSKKEAAAKEVKEGFDDC